MAQKRSTMNKLIKFSRAILAIAMMLSLGLPSLAHDFEVDGIYYKYLDKTKKTVAVTFSGAAHNFYNEYTGEITIPSMTTYNGKTFFVTEISQYAFSDCTGLTAVTIPNSVTSISDNAFSGCWNLTNITIPNSVTFIGASAFTSTAWLSNKPDGIVYINDVLYNYKGTMPNNTSIKIKEGTISISPDAFMNCIGLSSITIPNTISTIGRRAFYNCSNLTSFDIPDSVVFIGDYAFSDTPWYKNQSEGMIYINNILYGYKGNVPNNTSIRIKEGTISISPNAFSGRQGLNSIIIPNTVISIGAYAFRNCTNLKSVAISNSITKISESTFEGCTNLSYVNIPNSVTLIETTAFYNCTNLTSIIIPNSVTRIEASAFNSCYNLTSIVIPNSVTEIGYAAFRECRGLKSVTIGNSVAEINEYAFNYCNNLNTIISLNSTPPICANNTSFHFYSPSLFIPDHCFSKYFVDDVWGLFNNIKKIETLVSSITLNETTLNINPGSNYTLFATVTPSNATIPNISWESDNPIVATIDQNGIITGNSSGSANIIARANDGSNTSATCKVTVNSITPTITLSQTEVSLPKNDIITLFYSITNSTTKTATWSTSNGNVAYLKASSDGSATILGMADGVATITATMVDNGKEYSASCKITVGVGGVEGIETDSNAIEVARYDIYGRLLNEPTKGINIVKYSDGTTEKEIVK